MNENGAMAEQFEAHRPHLRGVAYRMLGSLGEAEDAVQEAWLRLSRAGASGVDNLGGWLTTVVARVCLDQLRSRRSRAEEPLDAGFSGSPAEGRPTEREGIDPEEEALLASAVGSALLVVLDTLEPAERLAFVLHDLFAVPFDEIAGIVGRSPVAARQLASRARRRVQGAEAASGADRGRKREIVSAFLAASREGSFDALLALLDPDVVLRSDGAAVQTGAASLLRGAPAVAETFKGRARAARLALLDGAPGAVWVAGGQMRVAFAFTLREGKIVEIEILADPELLAAMEVEILQD